MGVLGPVEVLPAAMGHRRHKRAGSDLIAGQLVGDNHPRHVSQTLEQLTENRLAATALRRDCTKTSTACGATLRGPAVLHHQRCVRHRRK